MRFAATLAAAASAVMYAPMLSVLFLVARMRAVQLARGDTDHYGLPQWWVQAAMRTCSYAVLGQVLCVVVVCGLSGIEVPVSDTGELEAAKSSLPAWPSLIVTVLRYVLVAVLYSGAALVCAGVVLMEGPKEIWGNYPVPGSPALVSTMVLIITFFAIYLGVAITRTIDDQASGSCAVVTKLKGCFTVARYTVNLGPMLSVLFIGARLRALQIDPVLGQPQPWAQCCFYACVGSIVLQAALCIAGPLLDPCCTVSQGRCEGDIAFSFENTTLETACNALRYLALAGLYGGAVAVIASVFLIQHPNDPWAEPAPPVSPAMQCVMTLTVQYFTVYTALFLGTSLNSARPQHDLARRVVLVFKAGEEAVLFAPMLCVLFLGARMRSLQLARAQDGMVPLEAGPQPWAQAAMFLATWAVLVQLVAAMSAAVLAGDGEKPQGAKKAASIAVEVLHYACLALMHGGAAVVIYAVLVMTPEELPPYAGEVDPLVGPPALR